MSQAVVKIRAAMALIALAFFFILQGSAGPSLFRLLEDVEFGLRDEFTRLRADSRPEERIVLIDIDEPSLNSVSPWPWSRDLLADLASRLIHEHGVQVVAFDMVFPEPRDPIGDARLNRLAQSRHVVLSEVIDDVVRIPQIQTGQLSNGFPIERDFNGPIGTGWVANHTGLSQVPCIGNIGFAPDRDGTLRQLPLWTGLADRKYPTLALSILNCLNQAPVLAAGESRISLRFPKAMEAWTLIPAKEILSPDGDLPLLANRIALIGSSALGLSDRVSTPLSGNVPGVFVHAQLLSELLDVRPSVVSWHSRIIPALWSGCIVLLTLSLSFLRKGWIGWFSSACTLGLVVVILALEFHLPSEWAIAPGLVVLLTLLLAQGSFEWARERSLARSSVRLLERYVSGAVLKTLLKTRNFEALKPRHTRITVLVVDLAGYSARVSEYTLEESTAFTRRLLEIMTGPVLSHGGTLDRYTGDGLVAFWGAPLAVPQAADRALQAALEIERLVRAELKASTRCGLATGEALVGDVGSAHRAHYTAVGGCINLAARLEALAKELGEQFLLDAATASELRSHKPESLGAREIRGVGEVELFAVTPQPTPEPNPTA